MTDEIDRDAARADFCRFLAACYYEPGPEFAEEGLFESMERAGALVVPELAAGARRLGEAFAAENASPRRRAPASSSPSNRCAAAAMESKSLSSANSRAGS